jgi:hypothetical protein
MCMNPAVFPAAAREHELIDLALFDHAEPQIVIERCGCYRLPVEHDLPLCKMRPARALRFVKMSYVRSYARTTAIYAPIPRVDRSQNGFRKVL